MARLCERPGCSAPAACVYGIDSRRLSVWIDGTVPDEAGSSALGKRAGVLCRRHADSMVVPIGWTLDDRRSGSTATIDQQRPSPLPRLGGRRQRRSPEADSEQLALLDVPVDESAAAAGQPATIEPEPAPRATSVPAPTATPLAEAPVPPDPDTTGQPVSPWRPVFDQTDDLGGLLVTRSPLLARAFGKRDKAPAPDEPAAQ